MHFVLDILFIFFLSKSLCKRAYFEKNNARAIDNNLHNFSVEQPIGLEFQIYVKYLKNDGLLNLHDCSTSNVINTEGNLCMLTIVVDITVMIVMKMGLDFIPL